jgi:hypothetical protein
MRFAFLAETSRCLSDSLDLETTLATVAGIALPEFGVWCMVDIVAANDSISRVAVIHPDAARQSLARDFDREHPPCREDPTLRLPYSAEATAAGDAAQTRSQFRERRAGAPVEPA